MLGGQDGTVPSAVSGDDMHPFRRPPLRAIKTASTIGFTICAAAARSNSLASGQALDRCPSLGRRPPVDRVGGRRPAKATRSPERCGLRWSGSHLAGARLPLTRPPTAG